MLGLGKNLQQQREKAAKVKLQAEVQSLHYNHSNAMRYDDDMLCGHGHTDVGGSGRWKRWKETCMVRVGFSAPIRTARELASRQKGASHSAIDFPFA